MTLDQLPDLMMLILAISILWNVTVSKSFSEFLVRMVGSAICLFFVFFCLNFIIKYW